MPCIPMLICRLVNDVVITFGASCVSNDVTSQLLEETMEVDIPNVQEGLHGQNCSDFLVLMMTIVPYYRLVSYLGCIRETYS